jgi:pimeloyl-ACP methyl ester carboxylesterase
MRRVLLGLLVALVVLLAVNTIVTDRETKDAKADIGQVVQLDGGDLQVREDGDANRPALVLLHGFAGSMHWWTPVAERLRPRFRVVRVDMLGHGGSEKPENGYGMQEQAKRIARALAELDVQRAVIVGHSMGGTVATAMTELDPSLVKGVVIVASPPYQEAGELPFLARLGFVPVLGQAIRRVVPDSVVRSNLENAFAGDFDVPDQFVEDYRRMTYTSYDQSHHESDDYSSDRGIAERLAVLRRPVQVIFGAEDEIVDPKSAQDYHRIPGAEVNVLQATGHSPMVEEPGRTARLIAAFARRQDRRR